MVEVMGALPSGGIPLGQNIVIAAETSADKSQAIHSRDKIEQHLIKQKARSYGMMPTGHQGCLYRGPNDTMCAAGCLIPDDKYVKAMEDMKAGGVYHNFPGALPTDITASELNWWQSYHDNNFNGPEDPQEMVKFSYKGWIDGNENHHPTKFKAVVMAHLEKYPQ